MSPEGGILAMIGGRNYAESQFNRTTQSLRQPGSAFKLFVYLAGLEDGLTPGSIFDDHPISIKIAGGYWQPHNYTNRFLGTITMEEAVSESVNTIAVQVAERTGLDRVIAMAHRLGLTNDMQPLPSLALGATEVSLLELTTAYAHMAADGAIVNPYGIVRIDNIRGEPLYERRSPRIGVAINSNVVGMMNQMLMKVVSSGTGRAAQIGRPVAGKTGTTSDYRDAWFMGFTPDLVTGTWVGNDNNEPMNKVTGGKLPAQIWHHFMSAALAGSPPKDIPTEGRFVSQGLPWLTGAPDYPSQPGNALATQPPHNESGRVNLGPSFWDKLFH
jgi:penicillin-binding protein 1A